MSIRTSRSSKRLIAAAVAVAVTASTFAISNNAGAAGTTDPEGDRIAGATRYETAAEIALAAYGENNNLCDVVLANGNSFADGLSAAGLADQLNAVILLTEANVLPAATVEAIEELADVANCNGPVDVTIVGGTTVVSNDVLGALVAHADVDSVRRFGGADRYATSLAVAAAAELVSDSKTVIITTGQNFPDALAAGVLAYYEGAPIILHDGGTPSAAVVKYITDNAVVTAFIIGGTSAVPQSIEDALEDTLGLDVTRLGGANRFETAVEIADEMGFNTGVVLANGRNFPDALAAAPLAYQVGAPILLVESGSIPSATAAWHVANADTLENVWVVGGTSVVSASVLTGAVAAATAVQPTVTAATAAFTHTKAIIEIDNGFGVVTLSAVAGSAADGTAGNAWSVVLEEVATATAAIAVAVDNTNKEITVTVKEDIEAVTAAQLATAWNASAAAALFVAGVDTAGAIDLTGGDTFDAENDGTLGTTVTTLTLTLNRPVVGTAAALASSVVVYDRNGPNGSVLIMPGVNATAVTGTRLSADSLTLTIVYNAANVTADGLEVPVLGTAEIRIAAGDLDAANAAGNPIANVSNESAVIVRLVTA